MEQDIVKKLVDEAVQENQELFLIDLKISSDNTIKVIVDGDKGVQLKECIRISRHVEHNLDRDTTDFSLEVTSSGATEPLVNKRQFIKNLGRTLEIKTETENFEGKLVKSDDKEVTIEWKAREQKPIGKGKITVLKTVVLPYGDIKQAKVKIKF